MRLGMRLGLVAALALVTACAGCGGGDEDPDARPPDARIDAPMGGCTGTQELTGELIDFDSTTANPMGVFDAVFTLRGEPGCTATTAPNGRFIMMVPAGVAAVVDIDAPGDYVDAIGYFEAEAITGSAGLVSLRLPTATRAAAFYTAEVGAPFDDPGHHLIVFDAPDRLTLSIDRSHDAAQAASDDDGDGVFTWADGSTGRYVLFPNIAAEPTATITGDPSGPITVPLQADRFTLAALSIVVGP